jgi:hypothetical protein
MIDRRSFLAQTNNHLINRRKTMRRTTFAHIFLTAILAVFALFALPHSADAAYRDAGPIRLEFDKQGGTNGIWNGAVSGDVEGSLTTQLLSLSPAGPIFNVRFAWIVSGGDQSFTAVLQGTLNTLTGQVEMDGTIVDGWLVGARVHEEGQMVDPTIGRFQGTITILPATAD